MTHQYRKPSLRGRKFYDVKDGRLVFVRTSASMDYWDSQWMQKLSTANYSNKIHPRNMVASITRKYLKPPARILEGGCGLAINSWQLHLKGYEVIALDYAQDTVRELGKRIPEVNPTLGDVHCLPFKSGSFDGYWSLGVIEHFYQGYDAILHEMHRVLAPEGYLFITFPVMSPLRKLLVKLHTYANWNEQDRDDFYQFALDKQATLSAIEAVGFEYREGRLIFGLAGAEDAFPALEPWFNKLRTGNKLIRASAGLINAIIQPMTGHMILIVMQKRTF